MYDDCVSSSLVSNLTCNVRFWEFMSMSDRHWCSFNVEAVGIAFGRKTFEIRCAYNLLLWKIVSMDGNYW